jgi:hypothetical protein
MTLDFSKCKTLEEVEALLVEKQKELEEASRLVSQFRALRDEFYQKTLLTEQEKNS